MTQDVAFVDECVKKHGKFLIPVLQDIQERYRYLPEELLLEVAEKLGRPLRDVYGVATFYRAFSLTPKGEHIVTVCLGTACHVRGGARIADTLSRELRIEPGDTTDDMRFTLETVNCLGCCAIGPIVVVDGEYYGMVDNRKALSILRKYTEGN
jgi:NADH:ubiquinone oxidoreductase subunit E